MCIFLLQNGTLWDICLMHCGIFEMCLLFEMLDFTTQTVGIKTHDALAPDVARSSPVLILTMQDGWFLRVLRINVSNFYLKSVEKWCRMHIPINLFDKNRPAEDVLRYYIPIWRHMEQHNKHSVCVSTLKLPLTSVGGALVGRWWLFWAMTIPGAT